MRININIECVDYSKEKINYLHDKIFTLGRLFETGDYVAPAQRIMLKDSYVSVFFVDVDEIHELNKNTRKIDSPTDVLSLPMLHMTEGKLNEPLLPEEYEMDQNGKRILNLGDIIICPSVACANAKTYGHSDERELLFLFAHSLLHLVGYDHIEEPMAERMIYLQKKLMVGIGLGMEDEEAEVTRHEEEVNSKADSNIAYPAGSLCEHCGYVSILGRPNVGKSTLVNYITGMKVAIVSHRPQTTRTNIRSIYNTDDAQVIFVDTPGVHTPGSKLAQVMVSNSFHSAKNSDIVLFIADGRFPKPGNIEKKLIDLCRENNKKVILAINKSDDIDKESLLPMIANYSRMYYFEAIVPISAKTGDNVDLLLAELIKQLPAGPRLFDSEYMTNQTEREITSELIREQILHYIDQEIPHGTAVEIDVFEEKYPENSVDEYDREMVVVKASIVCERDSHKGIIIGKDGSMLKRIGTASRRNIEHLLGCKVYLDLFVKVRQDWKNNDTFLKSFGYQAEEDIK